ncbi:2-oxo acid dehydrogenase subunit E2, partial [Nocardia mexicana]
EAADRAAGPPGDRRHLAHGTIEVSRMIDMTAVERLVYDLARSPASEDRIPLSSLLFGATALAARRVPELNGHWVDGLFEEASAVHLGVTVYRSGAAAAVPTISDADTLDMASMTGAVRHAELRAKAGRPTSETAIPATITVLHLRDNGAGSVVGVIVEPQVAIVGFGAVAAHPCVVDGSVVARPQLTATVSVDQRAVDGVLAARFLAVVASALLTPERL